MTDRFLSLWKEQFSFAHVHALAAQAGCAVTGFAVDTDSVDCQVEQPGRNSRGYSRPLLHLQLKCTSALTRSQDGRPVFDLPIKNYDELRDVRVCNPRILVVLEVPYSQDDWIECADGEICLRHRAYWTSLRGEPAKTNKRSVRVAVPELFDAGVLDQLLDTIDPLGRFA